MQKRRVTYKRPRVTPDRPRVPSKIVKVSTVIQVGRNNLVLLKKICQKLTSLKVAGVVKCIGYLFALN